MKKTDDMPIWVYLAFSSIETRKMALWLIWACALFTVYCIPWHLYFTSHAWVAKVFLIDNWSWFAGMVPMTLWYWASLRWIDKHVGWSDS